MRQKCLGQQLISRSHFSLQINAAFFYNHTRGGSLIIVVGVQEPIGDSWLGEIVCVN